MEQYVMKIAAAQIQAVDGDIEANIRAHVHMIEQAAEQNVKLIIFPEMSLTGYERELADTHSFSDNDVRLNIIKEKAVLHQMIIIAGAPLKINSALYIGSLIFLPDGRCTVYTKQFLHEGEEKYFSASFDFNPILEAEGEKISLAICADIANPIHAANAGHNKSSLYLASIFYTPSGIGKAYEQLSAYARKYAMKVLMANYCGTSYGMAAAGLSACWNEHGQLIAQLNEQEEGLLIATL